MHLVGRATVQRRCQNRHGVDGRRPAEAGAAAAVALARRHGRSGGAGKVGRLDALQECRRLVAVGRPAAADPAATSNQSWLR